MSGKGSPYRNIVLISQIGINMLVPVFICVAVGVWLDNRFHTWFTLPLLILGIAAGARNAYYQDGREKTEKRTGGAD